MKMEVTYIRGDLLTFEADVIVQQCNCLTVRPHGLSSSIAQKLEVDLYKHRRSVGRSNLAITEDRGVPGKCVVFPTPAGSKPRHVACLLAQFAPGKPWHYHREISAQHGYTDNSAQRQQWFEQSLDHLKVFVVNYSFKTVAFPSGIGCGLAGGSWKDYLAMINDFAIGLQSSGVKVYIVEYQS